MKLLLLLITLSLTACAFDRDYSATCDPHTGRYTGAVKLTRAAAEGRPSFTLGLTDSRQEINFNRPIAEVPR